MALILWTSSPLMHLLSLSMKYKDRIVLNNTSKSESIFLLLGEREKETKIIGKFDLKFLVLLLRIAYYKGPEMLTQLLQNDDDVLTI